MLAVGLAVVLAALSGCSALERGGSGRARAVQPLDLVIVHSSDAEGLTDASTYPCGCAGGPIGGFARRTAVVKAARAENADLLLLDGGNTLAPPNNQTQLTTDSKTDIEAMNLMGYGGMALGEDDLRLGATTLAQCIAAAQFPLLSANVTVQTTRKPLTRASAVIEAGGGRVGLIGLTGIRGRGAQTGTVQPTAAGASGGALAITDPTPALSRAMQELRDKVDLVIVLANLDWDVCTRLADTTPGVGLVICSGLGGESTVSWQAPKTGAWVWHRELPDLHEPGWVLGEVAVRTDAAGAITQLDSHTLMVDVNEDGEMAEFLLRNRLQ